MPPGMTAALAIGFILFLIVMAIVSARKQRLAKKAQELSVGRIQLGLDAPQTKGLRSAIEAAVRGSDPTTSVGIWRLSQRVLEVVAQELDHVRFAGFLEKTAMSPDRGEAAFQTLANNARAFFDREVVRKDAQGLVETERNSKKANELTDEDGEFGIDEYFVVTLIMAVRAGPLPLPAVLGAHSDVVRAVAAMHDIGERRHVGFEVIWTPAAESDILGRDELLVEFPELAPL